VKIYVYQYFKRQLKLRHKGIFYTILTFTRKPWGMQKMKLNYHISF